MERKGERFVCRFPVEPETAFVSFHFVTPTGFDRGASLDVMVYRPDGKPARGARIRRLFQSGPDGYVKTFNQEIDLYPDHYAAYRQKWFAAGAFDKENQADIIRSDLASLRERVEGRPLEYLYSLAYGLTACWHIPTT